MSYSDVFGGATIYPAGQTYLSLIFSTDQELAWPIEQAIAGQNVVSSIMDLAATAPGLNVDLPDARQVSQGIQSVFNNVSGGGETITIRDATGGVVLSIVDGTAWVAYLTDNTTEAGSWRIFQLGAGMTVAVASALAGAGIKAITTTLNQTIAPTSTAVTPITWTNSDRAQLTIWTGGLGVLDFPNPGVVGSDWFSMIRNGGTGDLTLTPPSGVIDDLATLILGPGESATIVTDGTNFFTVGLGQSTAGFFDFVEINVAGSGDFTLSGVQLNRISYRFTGALTGNRNIVVPNTVQQYWVDNSTTGAFSFFVNTVAQVTPVQIIQGDRTITYCDGTDVIPAESATVSFPISIGQGGTGANNAVTALSNLGGVPLARLLNTAALSGLAGGGDLTADRDFVVDVDNLTTELTVDLIADTIAFYDDSAGMTMKTPLANITGLTIEDESVPLASLADTLDFVGAGVTASGVGLTKTITIPGISIPIVLLDNEEIQFGSSNDVQMFYTGVYMKVDCDGNRFVVENDGLSVEQMLACINGTRGIGLYKAADTLVSAVVAVDVNGAFVTELLDYNSSLGTVRLFFAGTGVVLTAPTSGAPYPYSGTTGALLINNNTTGTGANERVTTYTDHMMTGAGQDDRNLDGPTPVDDNRLLSGRPCRIGQWKFELFAVFRDVGGTSNIVFDFDGDPLISECHYRYDFETADGTPTGEGAGDDKTTDQTVLLGSASEETMLRITGSFRMSATGTFRFRWAPTVNQVDTVSRMGGSWLTVCPIEIL